MRIRVKRLTVYNEILVIGDLRLLPFAFHSANTNYDVLGKKGKLRIIINVYYSEFCTAK